MRHWMLGCFLLTTACVEPGEPIFICERTSECDTELAWCEASGYCSWLDPRCESHRRYGGLAPEAIANQCVPVTDPDPLP